MAETYLAHGLLVLAHIIGEALAHIPTQRLATAIENLQKAGRVLAKGQGE